MTKEYRVYARKGHVACRLSVDGMADVCQCEVSVDEGARLWNISSWFTKPGYMDKGFGRETLKQALAYCIKAYGVPASIRYTWNGMNSYVLAWLERHFDAACICPIAVQKNQADDDWDSHIYELDNLGKGVKIHEKLYNGAYVPMGRGK